MKICFYTQDYENYGTDTDPYWKAKGGEDFIIEAPEWTEEMADNVCKAVSEDNPFFQRSVIGFDKVSDDYMTQFERDQLDYEGKIDYPAVRVSYDEIMKECV